MPARRIQSRAQGTEWEAGQPPVPRDLPSFLRKEKIMRALRRPLLALLAAPAAVLLVGASAQLAGASAHPAASAAHAIVKIVPKGCPEGTNWDNALQACV
jgi:hypothetical protein